MSADPDDWLALDVGGANLKAAHSNGTAASVAFAVWQRPDDLPGALSRLAARFPATRRVALTMTAELCDCYPTKRVGVVRVLDAVAEALAGRTIAVWGTDGRFHTEAAVRAAPAVAAASNWLALATVAARRVAPAAGLLVDVGSTTTDLIPLRGATVLAPGRDDTSRLQSGGLVYAGVSRTPLCALATSLPFRGRATGLAAELFATTRDVYLTLGDLPEDPEDNQTADGRPATKGHARDRLARMVGADREGFTDDDAVRLALAAHEALLARLVTAARSVCGALGGAPGVIVASGAGEFLARQVAHRAFGPGPKTVALGEIWGAVASGAACAQALVSLAEGMVAGQGRAG